MASAEGSNYNLAGSVYRSTIPNIRLGRELLRLEAMLDAEGSNRGP